MFEISMFIIRILQCLTAIFMFQAFAAAMVKRFMSINTNSKDNILKAADLRNELLIIIALEEVYELWSRFILNCGMGQLIDPDTEIPFNLAKDWKSASKKFT